MKVLVTGGAGYIGSFMVKSLLDRGYEVVVFDNLKRGHKEVVDKRAKFIEGDVVDKVALEELFRSDDFNAVMHFAGLISVEESEKKPEEYQRVNVEGSKKLFEQAIDIGKVKNFIFSSTAAVYGTPEYVPIKEDHPTIPSSIYGKTKLETENFLNEMKKNDGNVAYACLRYFNACGASVGGDMGENHNPETHIIPLAIKASLNNSKFKLYGTDYDTFDGTCIRDYIHVLDLVEAHLLALEKISKEKIGAIYNVGTGRGYSNREVLEKIKQISGKELEIIEEKRRPGDSSQLIADPTKINAELGFSPKYSDLTSIIESAWRWHSTNY